MAIKIGHASADERYKASGGVAGDQTGGEVCIRTWYSSPWDTVLRPRSAELAEASAEACEAACASPHIGYDQLQRNTLYEQAKLVGFDIGAVSADCECDCSSLMHVCAIAGGAKLGFKWNCFWTGNMVEGFMASGDYEKLTEDKYLTSDAYLKRGDILVRTSGHTAMALEDGAMAENGEKADVVDGAPGATRPTGAVETPETIPQSPAATAPFTQGSQSGSDILMNTPLPLLKQGDWGRAVWSMQSLLSARGYDVKGVDSDFGPNTDAALRAFQRAMGLEVDGECGAKSWAALIAKG